jgi:peptidoglycan/LPS O-acetylase OafA/YrhL
LSERSYGIYIVHFSVLQLAFGALAKGQLTRELCLPAMVVMSFLLADISFRFFETPILRRRPRQFLKSGSLDAPAPGSRPSSSQSAEDLAVVHASGG